MQAFKDDSIFQGWREFNNENGLRYRAEYNGNDCWHFYTYHDDVFVFCFNIFLQANATCLDLYNKYILTYEEHSRD